MDVKKLTIRKNEKVARDTYHMSLSGDLPYAFRPGQFIDILVDGFYLRRPVSIFDLESGHVDILYKVLGKGTDVLSKMTPGGTLDVLLPLGNGFDTRKAGEGTVLAGGGIGMPPIYGLAKILRAKGMTPEVVLGFSEAADIPPLGAFDRLGIAPLVAVEKGALPESVPGGARYERGLVTDLLRDLSFDYVFCCGPKPMLKAVYDISPDGQFSFEERMGCGFGACMGCTIRTKDGYKRVCNDGPVFFKEEIIW